MYTLKKKLRNKRTVKQKPRFSLTLNLGVLLLQVSSNTGDGSSSASGGNKPVDASVHLSPDLRAGGAVMSLRVLQVIILINLEKKRKKDSLKKKPPLSFRRHSYLEGSRNALVNVVALLLVVIGAAGGSASGAHNELSSVSAQSVLLLNGDLRERK